MLDSLIKEDGERMQKLDAHFDPISGLGSTGERQHVHIEGLPHPDMWLPPAMATDPFVAGLARCGNVDAFIQGSRERMPADFGIDSARRRVADRFERLRCQHDFAYWAARYVYIKCKGGGDDVLFRLTYPQRRFVERLEQLRTANRPIRLVLLKARQWGGSTTSQLYMAWLQLVHSTGLNSLIIAHQGTASDEIKDMFDRMIHRYPLAMLHQSDEAYSEKEKKIEGVGHARGTYRVPQRNCKIKIGTAERPDSCRGGDYNLVHLSEVGLWKKTDGKRPEDIVRAACAGVLYSPDTMIVYESTANGVGNFFHREYIDARDNPRSQFSAMFVSWFDIPQNRLPFESEEQRIAFARQLLTGKDNSLEPSNREESGKYLWWLWQKGATLEGINWYVTERAKHSAHASMAAECPTDDTEAFVNSGAAVFDRYHVEKFRAGCTPPLYNGEIDSGITLQRGVVMRFPTRLDPLNLRFSPDAQGLLQVWRMPDSAVPAAQGRYMCGCDADTTNTLRDRYITVVDIGGRSHRADWSVIAVFDRAPDCRTDQVPQLVAQWRGHTDIDLLAWKAVEVAAFYDNSLLVIESNTIETHDAERMVDGDQSLFILNQIRRVYPNLYARRQTAEAVRQGLPRRYGFHTNISTKPMIITTLVRVVREGLYVERDERCLDEYLVYERKPNGAYGAIAGHHDDLLMTRAIAMHISYFEMPPPGIDRPMQLRHRPSISEATL